MSFAHCPFCGQPWTGHLTACTAPDWKAVTEFPLTHDDRVKELSNLALDYQQMELRILAALAVPKDFYDPMANGRLYGGLPKKEKSVETKKVENNRPFKVGDLVEAEFVRLPEGFVPRWNGDEDRCATRGATPVSWVEGTVDDVRPHWHRGLAMVSVRVRFEGIIEWVFVVDLDADKRPGHLRHAPRHGVEARPGTWYVTGAPVECGRLPTRPEFQVVKKKPESSSVRLWWMRRPAEQSVVDAALSILTREQLKDTATLLDRSATEVEVAWYEPNCVLEGKFTRESVGVALECVADHGFLPCRAEAELERRRQAPHEDWD